MKSNPYYLAVSHLFIWTGNHACSTYNTVILIANNDYDYVNNIIIK